MRLRAEHATTAPLSACSASQAAILVRSVLVVERMTGCHLVDVGLGMKVVAVHEVHTKAVGKHGANVRLPSSGHPP